jgi:ADP-heptose:LPS heptosyltransferase
MSGEAILVIRLGALGDFVLSSGPFQAIRAFHPDAHIVLLTTAPYEELARAGGWFDEIWLDERPAWWQLAAMRNLRTRLRGGGFSRVYDLQTSDRSSGYFRLFGRPRPEWSGIARGCSHPHANPARDRLHTVERQADQLHMAGIADVPAPDLSGIAADLSEFSLPEAYSLLVPGSAPHRPEKRWSATRYGELAGRLRARGHTPVLVGGPAEQAELAKVAAAQRGTINLCGRTSFAQIAALGRGARLAVGNDTGPMHLIATAGCPSLVLFSGASDPALTAPRGALVQVLQRHDLADLSVDEVAHAAQRLLPH